MAGNPKWVKGKSGNPNGRPKGVPTRSTKIRDAILDVAWARREELMALDAATFFRIVASLMPRVIEGGDEASPIRIIVEGDRVAKKLIEVKD